MDLLDFDTASLYFDEATPAEAESLVREAGEQYGEPEAETKLLRAYFLAPESLSVLVGLYRYYFYQHRLSDALIVANRSLTVAGARLGFPGEWRQLHPEFLGRAAMKSIGLLRFYLSVLKATAYVNLRLGREPEGREQLHKLIEIDQHDRLGGKALLAVLDQAAA